MTSSVNRTCELTIPVLLSSYQKTVWSILVHIKNDSQFRMAWFEPEKRLKKSKNLKKMPKNPSDTLALRRDNKTDKSTVRLEPNVIQKLGNSGHNFITGNFIIGKNGLSVNRWKVKCLDHSALSICKESRYIDGFMPLTMTALASIAGIFRRIPLLRIRISTLQNFELIKS